MYAAVDSGHGAQGSEKRNCRVVIESELLVKLISVSQTQKWFKWIRLARKAGRSYLAADVSLTMGVGLFRVSSLPPHGTKSRTLCCDELDTISYYSVWQKPVVC